jgi:hypothetical protein
VSPADVLTVLLLGWFASVVVLALVFVARALGARRDGKA